MRSLLVILFVGIALSSEAQLTGSVVGKKPLFKVEVTKTGPYFGWQRGKYNVGEIGVERQWKTIRLKNAVTHAAHMGVNYNFRHNVMGYDVGYWLKPHRIGLTYGANLVLRTDFDQTKVGVAPAIGFKFWLLHLQSGYHFLPRPKDFETNTFFLSIRIGIINDRDIDFKTRKKRKK